MCLCLCLKINLNASRPSEHPPVMGENVKTFLWDDNTHTYIVGGMIACKDKTSSWHFLIGFPNNGGNIGSAVSCRGETHRYTVYVCVCVCVVIPYVCVCVFIKLHTTAQSGPVILVILCH